VAYEGEPVPAFGYWEYALVQRIVFHRLRLDAEIARNGATFGLSNLDALRFSAALRKIN
jgi:hypothetical protein